MGRPLFSQLGLLSGCVDNVLLPTGNVVLNDSGTGYNFTTGVPNYKEFAYTATGLAGESQPFDGNGPVAPLLLGGRRGPSRAAPSRTCGLATGGPSAAGGALGRYGHPAHRHPASRQLGAPLQDRRHLSEQPNPRSERAGGQPGPA